MAIDVFGTSIHELTHAVHWGMDHDIYDKCQLIVYESYTRGTQHYLTSKKYARDYHASYWRRSYTGMMRDMIDGHKTVTSYSYREPGASSNVYIEQKYNDRVSGYTMKELEDALVGCTNWNQWRDKIKSKYPNKTDKQYVDEVFNYWDTK